MPLNRCRDFHGFLPNPLTLTQNENVRIVRMIQEDSPNPVLPQHLETPAIFKAAVSG